MQIVLYFRNDSLRQLDRNWWAALGSAKQDGQLVQEDLHLCSVSEVLDAEIALIDGINAYA